MKKVLTVDDSKVVRAMIGRHLARYDCQVLEASDGKEGVEAARQHKPDLILLDVTMPVMDGRQALAELHRDAACKSIPVIMLTAESGRELVTEIVKLGVRGYIVKPFKQETFDKEVSKILGAPSAAPVDIRSVLVVDDSEKVLEAARAALEKSMTVLVALGGKEALEQYDKGRPGTVIIDLAMPEMDGFQTLAHLKDRGPSIFIALAVRGDSAAHDKAVKAGYRTVVDKPFQATELLDAVLTASAALHPDEVVRDMVTEDNGCAIMRLPDPCSKLFRCVGSALGRKLHALAEAGSDKLIFDVAAIAEMNVEVAKALIQLLTDAQSTGIRTAICAPDRKVADGLQQYAEARDTLYAPSIEEARQRLQ